MKVGVLRAYAMQVEQVVKIELAELTQALQEADERLAALGREAQEGAESYLAQARHGATVEELSVSLGKMDSAIAARTTAQLTRTTMQGRWTSKREQLLEAVQYRKKLDILHERAMRERLRRFEQSDQRLLDERAWRRTPQQ